MRRKETGFFEGGIGRRRRSRLLHTQTNLGERRRAQRSGNAGKSDLGRVTAGGSRDKLGIRIFQEK
jgi:hypothetical protein